MRTKEQLLEDEKALLAEIERLHEREMNAKCCHCGGVIFAVEDEWAKAKAEIERLCHELADAHGVAQACEIRAERAEAEIERLRGLVRDAWKCATDDVGSPFWEQTEKRVREALGDSS